MGSERGLMPSLLYNAASFGIQPCLTPRTASSRAYRSLWATVAGGPSAELLPMHFLKPQPESWREELGVQSKGLHCNCDSDPKGITKLSGHRVPHL